MTTCTIGEYCRLHQFIHGAEAEELRERFEKLAKESKDGIARRINNILDDVDARDSCAFLESGGRVATQVSPSTEAVGVGNGRKAVEWQVSEGRDVICPECGHPFETGPIPVEVSPPTPEPANQVLTTLTILRERGYLGVSVAEALKIARLPRPCKTCHGLRWVMKSLSTVAAGGIWNEACPDCSSPPPEPEKQS